MKVGTDGVLLGSWCDVGGLRGADAALDVGCGTGLLALMIAQRAPCGRIDAVEIDPGSAADAVHNFAASPWSDRLRVFENSFQQYAAQTTMRYRHIVSNPPYFLNALKNPARERAMARHTDSLSFEELLAGVCRLLTDDGRFSLILPAAEAPLFENRARERELYCCRRLNVHSTPASGVRRVLMAFSRQEGSCEERKLVIESAGRHRYSEAYKVLTGDFYLRF